MDESKKIDHELLEILEIRSYTVYTELLVNGQFGIFKAMLTDIGMEWPKLPRRQRLPDFIDKELWHASPRVSR